MMSIDVVFFLPETTSFLLLGCGWRLFVSIAGKAAVVLRLSTPGGDCRAPFIGWMDLFSLFHANIIEHLFCIDKRQFEQLTCVAFGDVWRA
jgi:hypothetical protein